jgi:hypothetical protein
MMVNTKIQAVNDGDLVIEPFYDSDLKVSIKVDRITNRVRPFPHNMQTNNMQLLEESNYHLFNGDAAIYDEVEYISFSHLVYDIPFFKMGQKMIIIGHKIMQCNPHFTPTQLQDCLYHIFVYYCQIPKTKKLVQHVEKIGNIQFTEDNRKRIEKAVEQVMSTPFIGSTKKKSKVIYNPDYDLTTQERREVANEFIGRIKSERKVEQIFELIKNWDKEKRNPTQKNIAAKLDVSLRTIKTYWRSVNEKLDVAI